jgi:hypothetical protein
MAMLCLTYLSFHCFNPEASDDQVRDYILEAYDAFQDYAVAHWMSHLETTLRIANRPSVDNDLVYALEDFFDQHQRQHHAPKLRISQDVKRTFGALQGHAFHDTLLRAFSFRHANTPAAAEPDAEPLALEPSVRRIRRIFEDMVQRLPANGSTEADPLRTYYGGNWFKCPRLACNRFFDGFPTARERNAHEEKARSFLPLRFARLLCCGDRIGVGAGAQAAQGRVPF